ncbi:MAG: hypothetical protein IRZ07_28125, partial [Microbispora sp.]|nr:hypothetical protein [Microbispora sp.]
VRAPTAARRLNRAPGTIYSWDTRYNVRKWTRGRTTLYDYADLATIEGCINRGEPVPPTPEQRDQLRAQHRTDALAA